ncbi:hypothetical protein [Paractinoplanes rishiriensis]|uniref:Uncharacterized protein n=1 Tax=Paractinoplanes rishiriensis TaxID=1050105 RepID=A0A919K7J3_9ACTN|nr:hypothetical protein [Actinoplanes rishiriensis]GIF01519.1 hypothetical protein Ari01nite_89830 [Actinoplanes rishiriensis]
MTDRARPPGRNWSTIAAVLGGLAALITAVVGLSTFIANQFGDAPRATPAATTKPPAVQPATAASSAPAAGGWREVWSREFVLDTTGVLLDSDQPVRGTGAFHVISGGPMISPAGGAAIAALPAGQPATPDACDERVTTHSADNVTMDSGKRVCVRTPAGRVALLVVEGATGDVNAGWTVRATVWQPAS